MKRILHDIADYFAIGYNEARGVLLLFVVILLCIIGPLLYHHLASSNVPDTNPADQRKLDSLVAIMRTEGAADEQRHRNQYRPRREDNQAEHRYEAKPFPFDPNTVSVSGWQQLGLPRWLAERIDKYRSKGGQFRKKEDLLRIYDFPPELYDQLEAYIHLPASNHPANVPGQAHAPTLADAPNTNVPGTTNAAPTDNIAAPTRERTGKYAPRPFDINTADTNQLIALKGIGSKLAARILTHRDNLGGFHSAEQFDEIYGLDSINRAQLVTFAKIQSPVRKTPINTASATDLDRFPFLSRRQAEVIVNYRNQHGAFASVESLRLIRVLDAKTIEKLTPYLSF